MSFHYWVWELFVYLRYWSSVKCSMQIPFPSLSPVFSSSYQGLSWHKIFNFEKPNLSIFFPFMQNVLLSNLRIPHQFINSVFAYTLCIVLLMVALNITLHIYISCHLHFTGWVKYINHTFHYTILLTLVYIVVWYTLHIFRNTSKNSIFFVLNII